MVRNARSKHTSRAAGEPAAIRDDKKCVMRERFIAEYLADPTYNATAAYLRAGYPCKGGSARAAASRLIRHPEVKNRIGAIQEERSEAMRISREKTLAELCQIAFFEVRTLFRDDGSLKKPSELSYDTAAALRSYEVYEQYKIDDRTGEERIMLRRTKIKLNNKTAALDSILKILRYDLPSG